MQTKFKRHLRTIGACQAARDWVGNRSAKEAWQDCENVDWLLWWAARDGASHIEIVLVACDIAELVVHLSKTSEAQEAINAARLWANNPTPENKIKAYNAAYAAANAAATATYAAYAATYAAANAANAAYVATAAADAATAATTYAAATANAAATAAYVATAAADAATAATTYAAADAAADVAAVKQKILQIIRKKLPQPWSE